MERDIVDCKKSSLAARIKYHLREHIVDSTAVVTETTPIFAAVESFGAGMPDDLSMNVRLAGAIAVYLGFGSIFSRGRDFSRRYFRLSDYSRERYQELHDAAFNGAYNCILAPFCFLAGGSRDWKEIAVGTFGASLIGFFNGIPKGYAVDFLRDLSGQHESHRVSKWVHNKTAFGKTVLGTLFIGGSLVLTSYIYILSPDKNKNIDKSPSIERVIIK